MNMISCINNNNTAKDWIAVVLINGYSTLSLGAIIEPFAQMHQFSPDNAPQIRLTGLDSQIARSSGGVEVRCELTGGLLKKEMLGIGRPQALIVCGPTLCLSESTGLIALLRDANRLGIRLYGIGKVVRIMAEAGVLSSSTATLHWKSLAAFDEVCRPVQADNVLYILGEQGGTCAGELATLDMVMNIIADRAPQEVEAISNHLLITHHRGSFTRQPGSQSERLRHAPPVLSEASRIMSENIEDPLRSLDIAEQCECSLRQIERLFRKHVGISPMQYYIRLRLERASELVLQTNLSFHEIAAATGFSSSSSLTKKLKEQMGVSLSEMREQGRGKNSIVTS